MAPSKLRAALEKLRAHVDEQRWPSDARPLTRPPWVGVIRQYPVLAGLVDAVVANVPDPDAPGDATKAAALTFASRPYVALALERDAAAGVRVAAFLSMKSQAGPDLDGFVAEHASAEHGRTILVCSVVGGA